MQYMMHKLLVHMLNLMCLRIQWAEECVHRCTDFLYHFKHISSWRAFKKLFPINIWVSEEKLPDRSPCSGVRGLLQLSCLPEKEEHLSHFRLAEEIAIVKFIISPNVFLFCWWKDVEWLTFALVFSPVFLQEFYIKFSRKRWNFSRYSTHLRTNHLILVCPAF